MYHGREEILRMCCVTRIYVAVRRFDGIATVSTSFGRFCEVLYLGCIGFWRVNIVSMMDKFGMNRECLKFGDLCLVTLVPILITRSQRVEVDYISRLRHVS